MPCSSRLLCCPLYLLCPLSICPYSISVYFRFSSVVLVAAVILLLSCPTLLASYFSDYLFSFLRPSLFFPFRVLVRRPYLHGINTAGSTSFPIYYKPSTLFYRWSISYPSLLQPLTFITILSCLTVRDPPFSGRHIGRLHADHPHNLVVLLCR